MRNERLAECRDAADGLLSNAVTVMPLCVSSAERRLNELRYASAAPEVYIGRRRGRRAGEDRADRKEMRALAKSLSQFNDTCAAAPYDDDGRGSPDESSLELWETTLLDDAPRASHSSSSGGPVCSSRWDTAQDVDRVPLLHSMDVHDSSVVPEERATRDMGLLEELSDEGRLSPDEDDDVPPTAFRDLENGEQAAERHQDSCMDRVRRHCCEIM